MYQLLAQNQLQTSFYWKKISQQKEHTYQFLSDFLKSWILNVSQFHQQHQLYRLLIWYFLKVSLEAASCVFSSSCIWNKVLKILRNKGLQPCSHTSCRKIHKWTGVHAPCAGLNPILTNATKSMLAILVSWLVIQILKNEWAIRLP